MDFSMLEDPYLYFSVILSWIVFLIFNVFNFQVIEEFKQFFIWFPLCLSILFAAMYYKGLRRDQSNQDTLRDPYLWYSILATWIVFCVLNIFDWQVIERYKMIFLLLPIAIIIPPAMYYGMKIFLRAYTSKDYKEAGEELKREINEAYLDLKRKGFKFDEH